MLLVGFALPRLSVSYKSTAIYQDYPRLHAHCLAFTSKQLARQQITAEQIVTLSGFFVRLDGPQFWNKAIMFLVECVQWYSQCYRYLTDERIKQSGIVTEMILCENAVRLVTISRHWPHYPVGRQLTLHFLLLCLVSATLN